MNKVKRFKAYRFSGTTWAIFDRRFNLWAARGVKSLMIQLAKDKNEELKWAN